MANKRALIVDDSTTAQYRLKKMLRAYALDIDVADSGEAALRYLANNVPDVVFMDHTMPGMDGLRALQVIKSHPETAVIPVIMYTAQSGDVYTGQARALGALDVVSKDKINATDLSRVMEAIHIYPINIQEKTEANKLQPDNQLIKKTTDTEKVTDITSRIERRTNAATAEHIRNLDYRLSQLENLQEDNRRFIVARLLRELQILRQSVKQEINNIPHPQPVAISPVEKEPNNSSIGFKVFFTAILMLIVFFLLYMAIQLSNNTENQTILRNQLEQLATNTSSINSKKLPIENSTDKNKNTFLTDLVWMFNQQAQLTADQDNPDFTPLLQLHDLLNRISASGFKGNALITISIGNFCNAINDLGSTSLATEETNINNCIFSNELYSLERLIDNYSHQAHIIMDNLNRNHPGTLNIIINAQQGKLPYPERISTLTAGEWNRVASNNNRIDLVLLPE